MWSTSRIFSKNQEDSSDMDEAKLYRFIAQELINADFSSNGVLNDEHGPSKTFSQLRVELSSALSKIESNIRSSCKPSSSDMNNSHASNSSKASASVNQDIKVNGVYAINSIKNILELYDKHCLTITDTINLLHSFISRDMLKVPNGTPSFLIQEKYQKIKEFEAYYKTRSDKNLFCFYCKWLGLPPTAYNSHILKEPRDIIYCPLYPAGHDAVLKFDNFGKTVVNVIEKMGEVKFCNNCKNMGLPRENFMSHVEKLPTGEVICPELRKQRKSNSRNF